MIFYTVHENADTTHIVDWAGTQADARAACKARDAANPGNKEATWQEHDVPTDKPRLLAWLKAHAVGLGNEQVEQLAELLHLGQPETPPQTFNNNDPDQ